MGEIEFACRSEFFVCWKQVIVISYCVTNNIYYCCFKFYYRNSYHAFIFIIVIIIIIIVVFVVFVAFIFIVVFIIIVIVIIVIINTRYIACIIRSVIV